MSTLVSIQDSSPVIWTSCERRFFPCGVCVAADRKSTRLNSSHSQISYAVFCLKKKNTTSAILARTLAALPSRDELCSEVMASNDSDSSGVAEGQDSLADCRTLAAGLDTSPRDH